MNSIMEEWRMNKKVNGFLNNPPDGVDDFVGLGGVRKK
jgi:hypothetical protein